MRFLNYLKEDWYVRPSSEVGSIFKQRWGGGKGNEIILYVYDIEDKNLYWKIESEDEIVKNKYDQTWNSKTEDHTGILFAVGKHVYEWGVGWVHGIIIKNKIYPYEGDESKITQDSLAAIRRYIKKNWWVSV